MLRSWPPFALAWSVLAFFWLSTPALAHGVHAECYIQGDQIEVRVFFADEAPVPHAQMTVLDESKNTIATGTTNAEGRWSFPLPPPGKYTVKADAGTGHRVTARFTVPNPAAIKEGASPLANDPAILPESTWLRAAIGLLVIGALAVGLHWLLRKRGEPEKVDSAKR